MSAELLDIINTSFGSFDLKQVSPSYRYVHPLKKAHGIDTLLLKDIFTNQLIVLKIASKSTLSTNRQLRLMHEAEVLSTISSHHLSPLISVGEQGDLMYFAAPFISGITLRERLRSGVLSVKDALTLGVSLFSALCDLHEHDVCHGDIKPENIIVECNPEMTRATLIDFGLARSPRLLPGLLNQMTGTAQYFSPEQAGVINAEVDARSDLYSAGVVLFECLAGHAPFHGNNLSEILKQHAIGAPAVLNTLPNTQVPYALSDLVQHLLEKEPSDRYQTAAAVVSDLRSIETELARAKTDPGLIIGLSDHRTQLTSPSFVGRADALDALTLALDQARQGRSGLVTVEGKSGEGKTRLVAEFVSRLSASDVWVLRGQGIDKAAQRPFQILVGVAQEVVHSFERDKSAQVTIARKLDAHAGTLASLFPELGTLIGTAPRLVMGPETFGEIRSLKALGNFVNSLGTPDKPALIILDDCQWADELSLRFLQDWTRSLEETRNVLIVACFRSEEVGKSHLLRGVARQAHLVLPPLDGKEIRDLLASMAGPLPESALDTAERLSEGSPFMASAVLYGMVETGALVPDEKGWRFEVTDAIQSSKKAATFLIRRFRSLHETTLAVLQVAAVLGKEFSINLLCELSDLSPNDIQNTLKEAVDRNILWKKSDVEFAFVHDKLREALLEMISEERRRDLHLLAALTVEKQNPDRVFELAYHFDSAGEGKRALPYAIAAAEESRSRHSLEIAERQYRIAERGASPIDSQMRYRIARGLGEVLMLRGNYHEARRQFEIASTFADSDLIRSELDSKRGELFFKTGDMNRASEALEDGLIRLGKRIPRHPIAVFFHFLWELLVQAVHTLRPPRATRRPDPATTLALRIYSRLTYTYWFGRGKFACGLNHLRSMNLAERYVPTLELAQIYSEHAPVATMVPCFARGIRYAGKSLAMRAELGDLWGQGQSLNFFGVVLYAASQFKQAALKCQEGAAILERTGDCWESNTAQWHIAYCDYRLGNLPQATARAKKVYNEAVHIGDHSSAAICLSIWSKASGGMVPMELIKEAYKSLSLIDAHTQSELLQAEAIVSLTMGETEKAIQALERAKNMIERQGLTQEYVAPVYPWLATAMRISAEKHSGYSPNAHKLILRRAWTAAKRALKVARKYRNNLPHAYRECGYVQARMGNPTSALRYFNLSIEVATAQGAKYERARTLLAMGRIKEAEKNPEAIELLGSSTQAIRDLKANLAVDNWHPPLEAAPTPTLSLADRFEKILELGRKIAISGSREELYQAIDDATATLLRADKCLIIDAPTDYSQDARILFVKGEDAFYSNTLVRDARTLKKPVVFVEERNVPANDSIILTGIRTALCAPILIGDVPRLVIYVSHKRIRKIFGEEEERLAAFISTLAGAALENIEMYETLQLRTQKLCESNEELERFASVASHDLQEPLRTVLIYSQLLGNRLKELSISDTDSTMLMKTIADNAGRMRLLISDLLTYSRISSIDTAFEAISMQDVVGTALKNLETTIKENEVEIEIGQMPVVSGNRTQLVQVVQNLIGNSIKFRGKQRPKITVDCEKGQGTWLFRIKDNGIGFDSQFKEQIFVIFKRLHTREAYPGTGIGLATCRRIVQRHGGEIWAESQAGKGATFFFSLCGTREA